MTAAVGAAAVEPVEVLQAAKQRVVVVRRRVGHATGDALADEQRPDVATAGSLLARRRVTGSRLLVAAARGVGSERLIAGDDDQAVFGVGAGRLDPWHPLRQEV